MGRILVPEFDLISIRIANEGKRLVVAEIAALKHDPGLLA
jgi:hypothetical protein